MFLRFILIVFFIPWATLSRTVEIYPAISENDEEFERIANTLKPGDSLLLHGGTYIQTGRRAITAKGTPENPIIIQALPGESPLLSRPVNQIDGQNNLELVDCEYLEIRGIRFQGGSSGVRFIRGHHITFANCEIFDTGNNALTMNSGNCHAFIIRSNHIHHTGLSKSRPTEGEGMYIGGHDGSCRTTDSIFEGNYIHHLRSTSSGGNDGIEIKFGSGNNIVRNNVIHDTTIGRQYPGIFVYGGGSGTNIVEANVIWNAGEGIQVVSDAIVRNNIVINCMNSCITAGPHATMPHVRNTTITHNTLINAPVGIRLRWAKATNSILANNAIYCPNTVAVHADDLTAAIIIQNAVCGGMTGAKVDEKLFISGGSMEEAFMDAANRNFWPTSNSVLRGHAVTEQCTSFDYYGKKRIQPFDIGAVEADGSPPALRWPFIPR